MSTHDDHDETARRLTSALNREAETVSTDPTALQRIQRRTSAEGASSRQRWFLAAMGAAAATAAVIAAVVVIGETNDTQGGPAPSGPNPSHDTASEQPPSPVELVEVPVTYVGLPGPGRASRLYTRPDFVATSQGQQPVDAADLFLAGKLPDPDFTTGWPKGLHVSAISSEGGMTRIELEGPAGLQLSPDPDLGADGGQLALQALLRTAGLQPGEQGTVSYDGDPVSVILGVQLPVTVKSDDEVRAWISIDNIVHGQEVSNPVKVKVSGNVFEGTVNWELLDANGSKLDDGYVTTSMGTWTQTDIELGQLEPGTYTFRALEYSAANGKPLNVDDKTFTVE